jgi:hypothetical protein
MSDLAKKLFHSKISAILVPLFWGLGLAMVGIAVSLESPFLWLFVSAFVFFIAALVWTIGFWLTSDSLNKRNPSKWNRRRKQQVNINYAGKIYQLWRWSGCIAACAVFALFAFGTYQIWKYKELSQLHGTLIPANDPTPNNNCEPPPPENALMMFYGNATAYTTKPHFVFIGYDLLKPDAEPIISLDREPNGNVVLNAKVFSEDRRLVTSISKNEFHVNRNNIIESLFGRPDKSTLVITDQYDNEFRVRLLNKNAVSLTGVLYSHGTRIEIDPDKVMVGKNLVAIPCASNFPALISFH